ncbi:MAG: NUDIX hydrolase [bacterium]|nr:NUDIX hydrolase [bacterium]
MSASGGAHRGPVVGVGALVIKDGCVLLIQRGRFPGVGLWAIPGGKQNFGESLQQTAAREILEETGVLIRAGNPIYCFEALFDREGRELEPPIDSGSQAEAAERVRDSTGGQVATAEHHFVVIDLAAEYLSGEATPGDDAADAGWFSPADAADLPLQPATRRFLEHVEFL